MKHRERAATASGDAAVPESIAMLIVKGAPD
jgi:hypothetical protein